MNECLPGKERVLVRMVTKIISGNIITICYPSVFRRVGEMIFCDTSRGSAERGCVLRRTPEQGVRARSVTDRQLFDDDQTAVFLGISFPLVSRRCSLLLSERSLSYRFVHRLVQRRQKRSAHRGRVAREPPMGCSRAARRTRSTGSACTDDSADLTGHSSAPTPAPGP